MTTSGFRALERGVRSGRWLLGFGFGGVLAAIVGGALAGVGSSVAIGGLVVAWVVVGAVVVRSSAPRPAPPEPGCAQACEACEGRGGGCASRLEAELAARAAEFDAARIARAASASRGVVVVSAVLVALGIGVAASTGPRSLVVAVASVGALALAGVMGGPMDVRAPRRAIWLLGAALVAAGIVVEGVSTPFTWPARLATGALIAWGLGVARPWTTTDGIARVVRSAVVAALVVATVFTAVELVELVHGPRGHYPTFSSMVEAVVLRSKVDGFGLGRSVLAAAWVVLGRWLLAP